MMYASAGEQSLTMLLASLTGALPLLLWLAWEFGYRLFIPYFFLHVCSGSLAIRLQKESRCKQWFGGVFVTAGLNGIKTIAVRSMNASPLYKMMIFVSSGLWECSNGALLFGGQPLLSRMGIGDSQLKALIVVLSPTQVKFASKPLPFQTWLLQSLHLCGFFVVFVSARVAFWEIASTLETNLLLKAEAIAVLVSCFIMIWDLPCNFWQLAMIHYPVRVVYPYGNVYVSTSMRSFWSKWSRPASQMIRHAIYYPLGGAERAWLSVSTLFIMNATSHYGVSNAVVGDRAIRGWNIIFGVLGVATLLEMLGDRHFGETSEVYVVVRAVVAHCTLLIASYTLVHKVLHLSLLSFS